MRQLSFLILVISLLSLSCRNAAPVTNVTNPDTLRAANLQADTATKAATRIDPVCEMAWDTGWTDMTVYEQDTLKFCSEACKKTFLARPAKYMKSKAGNNI